MNKKILAAAVAALIAAPAVMADVTVYGKVRQSVDMIDQDEEILDGETVNSETDNIQINNHASRLGFKGSEDLGNGLKAIFKMEFGVGISDGKDVMSKRNAYVGLAGDFGTVLIGRHDHPLKMSTGSLDPFADTAADYNKGYMEGLVDLRADGAIVYMSPNFSGLTVAGAILPGENNAADGIAGACGIERVLYVRFAGEFGCYDSHGRHPNFRGHVVS